MGGDPAKHPKNKNLALNKLLEQAFNYEFIFLALMLSWESGASVPLVHHYHGSILWIKVGTFCFLASILGKWTVVPKMSLVN